MNLLTCTGDVVVAASAFGRRGGRRAPKFNDEQNIFHERAICTAIILQPAVTSGQRARLTARATTMQQEPLMQQEIIYIAVDLIEGYAYVCIATTY